MTRHIMLSFMSPYRDVPQATADSEYYGPNKYQTTGRQTNEPALLYILSRFKLDKYYFFCSKKVQESLKFDAEGQPRSEKLSHVDYFKQRLEARHQGFAQIMEPLLYNEEIFSEQTLTAADGEDFAVNRADMLSVQTMSQKVKEYALPLIADGEDVVMHVDMTGGFRHASMLMLAVVGLLKYSGISIGKVLYTNYDFDKKIGKIEEVTETHNIMQLIAGAEAFVAYGSVDVLQKYFDEKIVSAELENLLAAMKNFSDSLKLCRTGAVVGNIKKLGDEIARYENFSTVSLEENLFKQLLDRIKLEYASVITGENKLNIILWCLKKGFLQQALTFYTEWVPQIIVSKGIVSPNSENIKRECQEQAPDYVSWEKYFLTNYAGTAETENKYSPDITANLRSYFETQNENYRKKAVAMLTDFAIDTEKVFYQLNVNDFLVAKLKNGQATVTDIRNQYPKLHYAVDRIYYGNPNNCPSLPFKEYWCQKLTAKEIFKRLAKFKTEWLMELFDINEQTAAKLKEQAAVFTNKISYPKALSRKATFASLLNKGTVKSNIAIETALDIVYEYNVVRLLRNECNHAMGNTDVLSVDEIVAKLSKNIKRFYSDNLK